MSRLPESFKDELNEVDELLDTAQRRLISLKDYADFDGLPRDVTRRLENKNRVLGLTREDLSGIPALVEPVEAAR